MLTAHKMQPRTDTKFEQVIRSLIFGVVFLVWATLGGTIWIAMVIRVTVSFCGAVFVRIVQGEDTRGAGESLNYALHFWLDGFHRVFDIQRAADSRERRKPGKLDLERFLSESCFAIALVLVSVCAVPLLRYLIILTFGITSLLPWAILGAGVILAIVLTIIGSAALHAANQKRRDRLLGVYQAQRTAGQTTEDDFDKWLRDYVE